MQDFIDRMRSNARRFMRGRYGIDQLGWALLIVAFLCALLSVWVGKWLNVVTLALLGVACWRILSTNLESRRNENRLYLTLIDKPRTWFGRQKTKWDNRKTKAYVRCPHCQTEFALPKGKGKLRATCPSCGEKSIHTV